MNIELKGKIVGINATEVKSEKFSKREFKVKTDGQYPEIFKIQVTNDKCPLLDKFKVNDNVNVHCNLKGRDWTKPTTGEVSNFISLDCWRIEPVTNEGQIENTILEEPPF
jgi:single-strand DNA-binding protein